MSLGGTFTGGRLQIEFKGPGRTRQSMKKECDINVIVQKYKQKGFVDHVSKAQAVFGDAPVLTFFDAMEQMRQAQELFDALPSEARNYFDGNPRKFLEAVDAGAKDEMVYKKLVDLGLAKAKPEPAAAAAAAAAKSGDEPPA